MDHELFKELGFTEREVKVYLALSELGSSTVGPISKKTKLQPAKVYETIDKLKEVSLRSGIFFICSSDARNPSWSWSP